MSTNKSVISCTISLLIRKHSFQCSYFEEVLVDSCLGSCGPLRGACLTVLNMIACDWSRTRIHRLFPFHHHWMISNFSQSQVIGRACGMYDQTHIEIMMTMTMRWWECVSAINIDVNQSIDTNQALAWSSPHKWSCLSVWMQVPAQRDWLHTPGTGRPLPQSDPPPATQHDGMSVVLIRFCTQREQRVRFVNLINSIRDGRDVNFPPHGGSAASLVHIIFLDIWTSREKRLFPCQEHWVAVTAQQWDVIRSRGRS